MGREFDGENGSARSIAVKKRALFGDDYIVTIRQGVGYKIPIGVAKPTGLVGVEREAFVALPRTSDYLA